MLSMASLVNKGVALSCLGTHKSFWRVCRLYEVVIPEVEVYLSGIEVVKEESALLRLH